jgi:inorganic pyrophosphatase
MSTPTSLTQALGLFFQAHPWHGVSPGEQYPEIVTSYIEMVPTDAVKYEVDKATGILKLDRPQRYSNQPPSLYGFIPRTLCDARVGERCGQRLGRTGISGDGDPIDICVLTEKPIQHGAVLVEAIPIGGLRMIDGNQADDKIIAVLKGDSVYGKWKDIADVPQPLIDRLRHYFLTYKAMPDSPAPPVEIAETYDATEARETIRKSVEDYRAKYGQLTDLFAPNR